jgi:hypothetical protein
LNGGDAGILWAEYSPYPEEAGIAGRRYKQLAPLYTDSWALLMAVAEAAFEGHHAAGSCRGEYLRSRAARIRETVHSERSPDMSTHRFSRGLHPLSAIIARAFTMPAPVAVPGERPWEGTVPLQPKSPCGRLNDRLAAASKKEVRRQIYLAKRTGGTVPYDLRTLVESGASVATIRKVYRGN